MLSQRPKALKNGSITPRMQSAACPKTSPRKSSRTRHGSTRSARLRARRPSKSAVRGKPLSGPQEAGMKPGSGAARAQGAPAERRRKANQEADAPRQKRGPHGGLWWARAAVPNDRPMPQTAAWAGLRSINRCEARASLLLGAIRRPRVTQIWKLEAPPIAARNCTSICARRWRAAYRCLTARRCSRHDLGPALFIPAAICRNSAGISRYRAFGLIASRQLLGKRCNGRPQIITPCDQSSCSHRKCKVPRVARGNALQLGFDAEIKQGSRILQIR